jgi:hypothetical protein
LAYGAGYGLSAMKLSHGKLYFNMRGRASPQRARGFTEGFLGFIAVCRKVAID